jgi:hypothetical protein
LLSKLSRLRVLALKKCPKLTSDSAKTIANAPSLEVVDIIDTKLTEKMIAAQQPRTHKIKTIFDGKSQSRYTVREVDTLFHPLK